MFQIKKYIPMLMILLLPSLVYAHRVTIFAWIEGDRIFTQSKFSGGKKVNNGRIIVFDKQGQQLLQGRTDSNGEFAFNIPQKTEMKIVVEAGMGHKAYWVLPEKAFENSRIETQQPPTQKKMTPNIQTQNHNDICLADIENIIKNTMDRKMDRMIKQLNLCLASKNDPSFLDILAGIGYILGLVGIGTYVHYRKKLNDMKDH